MTHLNPKQNFLKKIKKKEEEIFLEQLIIEIEKDNIEIEKRNKKQNRNEKITRFTKPILKPLHNIIKTIKEIKQKYYPTITNITFITIIMKRLLISSKQEDMDDFKIKLARLQGSIEGLFYPYDDE